MDKYLSSVFFAFMCLSITNFLYAVGWQVRGLEILDGLSKRYSMGRHLASF